MFCPEHIAALQPHSSGERRESARPVTCGHTVSAQFRRPDGWRCGACPPLPEVLRMAGTYSGLFVASDEDRVGTYWYVRGPLRNTLEEAKDDLHSLLGECTAKASTGGGT